MGNPSQVREDTWLNFRTWQDVCSLVWEIQTDWDVEFQQQLELLAGNWNIPLNV